MLFEAMWSWTNLLPLMLGTVLCVWALWLQSDAAKRRGMTVADRVRVLRRLRSSITLLPLSGLLGTMWSLMRTLGFMGEQAEHLTAHMGEVLSRFAPALSSTFLGVGFAMAAIVVIEISLHHLEESRA